MIAHIPARVSTQVRSTSIATNRPRRIDPVAGRSLVILAHAIEYLADEYSHQHEEFSFCDAGMDVRYQKNHLKMNIYSVGQK